MKSPLFLSLLVFLTACQSNPESLRSNAIPAPMGMFKNHSMEPGLDHGTDHLVSLLTLDNALASIRPAELRIEVDTQRDTVIETEKGVLVHIPKAAFCNKWGKKQEGKIDLVISEYHSAKDFFSEKLATKSESRLLATGGTVRIRAFASDRELELTDTSEIVLMFPRYDATDMETFIGQRLENRVMDWSPQAKREINIDSSGNSTGDAFFPSDWLPPVNGRFGNYYLRTDTLYSPTTGIAITQYTSRTREAPVSWKFAGEEKSMQVKLQEKLQASGLMDSNYFQDGIYDMDLVFSVDASGRLDLFEIQNPSAFPEVDSVIRGFFQTMPPLDPNLMGYLSPSDEFYLRLEGIRERQINTVRIPNEEVEKRMNRFREQAIASIDQAEVNYYIIATSKLGWINCDRFLNNTSPRVDFAVKLPGNVSASVGLVFLSSRSYLPGTQKGDKVCFDRIPLNEEVILVALIGQDDKVYFTKKDFVTDGLNQSIDHMRHLSLNQIDSALAAVRFRG